MSAGTPKRPDQDAPDWGGKREGAGRKPRLSRAHRVTVYLTDEDVERLRTLGNGNVSAGVRLLVRGEATR